jgi:hypothetical protein
MPTRIASVVLVKVELIIFFEWERVRRPLKIRYIFAIPSPTTFHLKMLI